MVYKKIILFNNSLHICKNSCLRENMTRPELPQYKVNP